MAEPGDQSMPEHQPVASTIAIAWVVTLLASSLSDIVWFERTGAVPLWLLWSKMGLLSALILPSWPWQPIRALRPFLIMLLAITALMRASSWVLDSAAWNAWQGRQSFAVAALAIQLLKLGVALLLIGLLFLLRRERQRFFLVKGNLTATATRVGWLGGASPGPLWRFGLVFTLVVIVIQIFMFILPLSPSASTIGRLMPLLPVILLLAVSNGFNEEITLRAAPISTAIEVLGRSHAIAMAAVLFGLAHYLGGIPSGVLGVLTTTFLGWFFGKCMVDSKGFFWPWLFHAAQDILPFTLMALTASS